jgi:RecJ-like exonuclease
MSKCPHCGGSVKVLACRSCGNTQLITLYNSEELCIDIVCGACNLGVITIPDIEIDHTDHSSIHAGMEC